MSDLILKELHTTAEATVTIWEGITKVSVSMLPRKGLHYMTIANPLEALTLLHWISHFVLSFAFAHCFVQHLALSAGACGPVQTARISRFDCDGVCIVGTATQSPVKTVTKTIVAFILVSRENKWTNRRWCIVLV